MATGIQTGMRRSARSSAPQSQQTQLGGTLLNFFHGLSRRSIIALAGGVLVLGLVGTAFGLKQHHVAQIDLYPVKLAAHEVPEISMTLLEAGIEHEVTPTSDGILLSRQERSRARSLLAARQLPRHRVMTADEFKSDISRGAAEKRLMAQRLLEGEIVLALREVDGIHDARVKIAIPERSYLASEQPTTASVTITTEPGASFSVAAIKGICSMVAFSVPGLTLDNVVLLDQKGRELSKPVVDDPNGLQAAHFEVVAREESRRQQIIQQMLDTAFPGRTKVVVSLDMDFSQVEKRTYTPGSEEDRGLVKKSAQLVSEIFEGTDKDSKNLESRKESVNYQFIEDYYARLTKHARVVRTSATVMADGFSSDETVKLQEAVRGALGLPSEKSDAIVINPLPWDRELAPLEELTPLPIAEQPVAGLGLMELVLRQGALLLAVAGGVLWVTRQRQRPAPLVATPRSLSLGAIVDHRQSKLGQTLVDSSPTIVSGHAALEGFVKERPAQVADMLRSTWLS